MTPYEALQETPAKRNLESNFQHLYRVHTMCCNIRDAVYIEPFQRKLVKKKSKFKALLLCSKLVF